LRLEGRSNGGQSEQMICLLYSSTTKKMPFLVILGVFASHHPYWTAAYLLPGWLERSFSEQREIQTRQRDFVFAL
jgi:hypothetical protein